MSFNLSYILTSIFFFCNLLLKIYILCNLFRVLFVGFVFVCLFFFNNVEVSKTLTGLKVENTIISMNLISLA